MTAPPPVPTPGSDAAIAMGCSCDPIMNQHGKGGPGTPYLNPQTFGIFCTSPSCPLHGTPTTEGAP